MTHSSTKSLLALSILSAASSLMLGGCASLINKKYTPPDVVLPTQINTSQDEQASLTTEALLQNRWWQQFNDPELSALIDRTLAQNRDLASAALKIRAAYLQAGLARINQFPSLSLNASSNRNESLDNSDSSKSYGLRLSSGYQLDLFGQLASIHDAAVWEARATQADRQSAALMLVSTLAQLYWQIGYLNERLVNAQQSLANAQKLNQIIHARYKAGAVSGAETAQSDQNLAAQQITLSQLGQQLLANKNALTLLFDNAPLPIDSTIHFPDQLPMQAAPTIADSIPASVLANRPDMAAAELRLRKALAHRNATKASFYPNINLTASLGTSSPNLADILKNPLLALGAGINLPFIEWPKMQRSVAISDLEYEQAIINFRSQLYRAFSDTYNLLTAHEQLNEQLNLQQQQFAASQKNTRLTRLRYEAGAVSLQVFLDAQDATRNAQNQLLQTQVDLLNNTMQFYTSTAGGETLELPQP